jgi:SAM-dependent methyltransferase
MAFMAAHLGDLTGAHVLEIGSYNVNGSVRALCHGTACYLGVDTRPGPDVDLVCTGARLPKELSVDCAICCEVLEHTAEAPAICAEAYRVLRPGGLFYVTCATDPRAPHSINGELTMPAGEYYRNVPPEALKEWLKDFRAVQLEVHDDRGDLYAVARK